MTMITPSYLGETIEYSSLHACRSTLEDPTEMFDYAGEAAFADISQNCVFTGKIPEEGWLADLENFDNIINAGVLVPLFAEQSKSRVDNLLAQASLLAFAQAKRLLGWGCLVSSPQVPSSVRVSPRSGGISRGRHFSLLKTSVDAGFAHTSMCVTLTSRL